MAQANVAREPSMEEILASIRKIIESNDSGDDPSGASGDGEEASDIPRRADISDKPVSLLHSVSDTDATLEPAEAAEPAADATPAREEPVVAAFHAMPLRAGVDDDDNKAETASRDRDRDRDMTRALETDNDELTEPLSLDTEAIAVSKAPVTPEPDTVEPLSAPEEGEPVLTDAATLEAPAVSGDEDVVDDERPLLSPAVGARVAASFDNLNHAVTQGPARSFDEIAEEMLRPMLQDWLDDNLPTLVERLVREEIERIARGQ